MFGVCPLFSNISSIFSKGLLSKLLRKGIVLRIRERKKWGFPHCQLLCADEMVEEKDPDKIDVGEDGTEDKEEDEEEKAGEILVGNEVIGADKDFDDPADDRDDEQDDLNETATAVEPFLHE